MIKSGGMRPYEYPLGSTRIHRCGPSLFYRRVKIALGEDGWDYEHRIVMKQYLGRNLSSDELVHHKNSNTLDNRIENLEIMSREDHVKHHCILDTWARDFDRCRRCDTQKTKHASRGVCRLCYSGRRKVLKKVYRTYGSLPGGIEFSIQRTVNVLKRT